MNDPATSHDLPSFPFRLPSPPFSLPPEYAERRAECPLGRVRLPSGDEAVLLVTYRDVAAVMSDRRLSRNVSKPGAARMTPEPSHYNDQDNLTNKEGEEHLRIRRIVSPAFTPRRIESWKPVIEQVAHELLDGMEEAGPPANILTEYCDPLPVRIICQLLGVPKEDSTLFRTWSDAFLSASQMTPEFRAQQIEEFREYIAKLVEHRRAEPGDALIDELIAARYDTDMLTDRELQYLMLNLIAVGNESTANALGKSLVLLLGNRAELWDRLVAEPAMMPAAVDELLRCVIFGNSATLRMAMEDIEVPSGTIRAGEAVAIAWMSAERDETVYPDPDTVRFDRDPPPALIFGGGPHYCLGAHLAKAELNVGLRAIMDRLPTLKLATSVEELKVTGGEVLSSLVSLPVTW